MVKGPATVVIDGACHVLGSDVSDRRIEIRPGKALPFEPGRGCRLRARFGRGGRMWPAGPEQAGVSMWHDVAQEIVALASSKKITVMLAGDTDTGKSTLLAYLANVVLGRGLVPCIVDGDIGQGDLAPPACIGVTALSNPVIDLRDASASLYEFVGSTSPAGIEHIVVKKLRSALERTSPLGDICIVNTDGYVQDSGTKYKLMLARELQPDAIVCLETPTLLDTFIGGPWQVLRARASSQVSKTRHERKRRRLDQFLRHVGTGSSDAELSQIKFMYLDRLFPQSDLVRPPIPQLEPENMKRMFVALSSNNAVKGFGIITDVSNSSMRVQTDIDRFDTICLSNIRLSGGMPVEIRIA
jgi:polynucleotide 5'-hydroxyl-kinase GRC3/NOL9